MIKIILVGWKTGTMVKLNFEMPTSYLECLGSNPGLVSNSGFLLRHTLKGSKLWLKYLEFCIHMGDSERIFHLVVHTWSTCNSQGQARPEPGTPSTSLTWVARTQALRPACSSLARSWIKSGIIGTWPILWYRVLVWLNILYHHASPRPWFLRP